MRRGSGSSELLMCGEGGSSILLLPRVAMCIETKLLCVYMTHICISVRCNDSGMGSVRKFVL